MAAYLICRPRTAIPLPALFGFGVEILSNFYQILSISIKIVAQEKLGVP